MEEMMNWDEIEGTWETFKGKIKQQWGKLTDDDLMQVKGKRDVLLGKIQQKYGYAKDQTEKELDSFLKSCSTKQDAQCCTATKDSSAH